MPHNGIRQAGKRNKRGKGNKKRDRRLGDIKYDESGKMIDDRNTEVSQSELLDLNNATVYAHVITIFL